MPTWLQSPPKRRAAVARLHERLATKRRNYLHNVSRGLVRRFGRIAVEKLNIKDLLSQPYLARDISDASWGQLAAMLAYKAESAGCSCGSIFERERGRPSLRALSALL